MNNLLSGVIQNSSNNYQSHENDYKTNANHHYVLDPFSSPFTSIPLDLTVSVVIAAWNAEDTILRCLISIEQSSFNQRYPQNLEVIVVDDGSSDSTWRILTNLQLDLNVTAIHQKNHSQPFAMNTGLSVAMGDIIISCDSDMILTPFTIEELIKRHQLTNNVLLVGFRYDVDSNDPMIDEAKLTDQIRYLIPKFYHDNRLTYHWDGYIYPGWPDNMVVASNHLKLLGHNHKLFLPDGDYWSLPRMVYGALFSMKRVHWLEMQGFDEQFTGWGWSDTFIGAKAIALGCLIVPVYSATGVHVAHKPRTQHQGREGYVNHTLYQKALESPLNDIFLRNHIKQAKSRIVHQKTPKRKVKDAIGTTEAINLLKKQLEDLEFLQYYYSILGRFDEAIQINADFLDNQESRFTALLNIGKLYSKQEKKEIALEYLSKACQINPQSVLAQIELALVIAAMGDFEKAKKIFQDIGRGRFNTHPYAYYIFHHPISRHLRRADKYMAQGFYSLALRDLEAVLIQEPTNYLAHKKRNHILGQLKSNPTIIQQKGIRNA